MFRSTLLISPALLVIGLAGCNAPGAPIGPTIADVHLADRELFLDDALTLLRQIDVPPRRIDRPAGLVVSQPTTSAQWFEFWRCDAPGGYQLLESSLHTIRRTVTIHLEPQPQPGSHRVSVEVQKERLNAPSRQVTTASGALAIYSERMPTEEGLRAIRGEAAYWTPLGRDEAMEQNLLDKLVAIAAEGRTVPPEPAPTNAPTTPPSMQPSNPSLTPTPRAAAPSPPSRAPQAAPPPPPRGDGMIPMTPLPSSSRPATPSTPAPARAPAPATTPSSAAPPEELKLIDSPRRPGNSP
ncbi:MAG: hypothetical protein U1D55_15320 [Phycisphaerae bacterium]